MAKDVWAMYCEFLPDKNGVRKIVMGHETYATEEEAQKECDKVRRQNLPFRSWPVFVRDPRQDNA